MFTTEFVVPILKQDAQIRAAFTSIALPMLKELLKSTPGALFNSYGFMIEENDVNIESSSKPVIGAEWESERSFKNFFGGEEFKAFGPTIQPLVTAKPAPEIYETSVSPKNVFSASLTEVFRVQIPNSEKLDAARESWTALVAAISKSNVSVTSLSGTSTNLDEKTFLGAVGWCSLADRDGGRKQKDIADARTHLLSLGLVTSFLVRFQAT